MRQFSVRTARQFLLIKAARELKKEMEDAGLDNLKTLADADISIFLTYLNGSSSQEKARIKRDLNALQELAVTIDMILNEVTRQMPELESIMRSRQGYKESEIQKIAAFLKES